MSIDHLEHKPEEHDTSMQTAALFVSLYVVILAFFIMLTSNAQFNVEKSKRVTESINKAFSMEMESDIQPFIESAGNQVSATQMFDEIREMITVEINIEEQKILQDDRHMELRIPVGALYNKGQTDFRSDRQFLMKRLVATMEKWRDEKIISVDIMHGVKTPTKEVQHGSGTLPVKRMGQMARYLENAGVPPHLLAVGIIQGEPEEVVMSFTSQPRPKKEATEPGVAP